MGYSVGDYSNSIPNPLMALISIIIKKLIQWALGSYRLARIPSAMVSSISQIRKSTMSSHYWRLVNPSLYPVLGSRVLSMTSFRRRMTGRRSRGVRLEPSLKGGVNKAATQSTSRVHPLGARLGSSSASKHWSCSLMVDSGKLRRSQIELAYSL